MSKYELCGTESPRTGDVHLWVRRDGESLTMEEVASDLIEMEEEIERLREVRSLLETAVDAWECGLAVTDGNGVVLADFRGAGLTRAWYDKAREAAGGDDE